jgi:hypothetical protein
MKKGPIDLAVAIYGCDTTHQGTILGKETVERIVCGLSHVFQNTYSPKVLIMLGAGKSPAWPQAPALNTLMSLFIKAQLENHGFYSTGKDKHDVDVFVHDDQRVIGIKTTGVGGWSTFGETVAIAENLAAMNFKGEVCVVSHSYHIDRILYAWEVFLQYKVMALSCPAHHISWQKKILEPLKMLKIWALQNYYISEELLPLAELSCFA